MTASGLSASVPQGSIAGVTGRCRSMAPGQEHANGVGLRRLQASGTTRRSWPRD